MKLTSEEALVSIKLSFPEIWQKVVRFDCDNSIYLAFGILANYINELLATNDQEKIRGLIIFLTRINKEGDSEVQNAIGVACIEHLKFSTKEQARGILTKGLYEIWIVLNEAHDIQGS